ncbi:unnamed protein product [Arctogadus glacialis]
MRARVDCFHSSCPSPGWASFGAHSLATDPCLRGTCHGYTGEPTRPVGGGDGFTLRFGSRSKRGPFAPHLGDAPFGDSDVERSVGEACLFSGKSSCGRPTPGQKTRPA